MVFLLSGIFFLCQLTICLLETPLQLKNDMRTFFFIFLNNGKKTKIITVILVFGSYCVKNNCKDMQLSLLVTYVTFSRRSNIFKTFWQFLSYLLPFEIFELFQCLFDFMRIGHIPVKKSVAITAFCVLFSDLCEPNFFGSTEMHENLTRDSS